MGGTQGTRRSDTGASALMVYMHAENLGNENTGCFSSPLPWNGITTPNLVSDFEQQ